ncbi:MAG: hypothetical protein E7646_02090 [Ruminococcaceae bacterium]|nr:hypothetical protein [Oscillospiraceae bacterium]
MISAKRVTLFCGHYGSGKTNLAVNYAFWLRSQGLPTVIADLDIVNPYFRTKDSREELEAAGIELISPQFANSNVDLPALPQQVYGALQVRSRYAVLDVGGDDRGALAMGRYTPFLKEENDYEMLFAVNFFRPLTPGAEEALEVMAEVEQAAGLKCTAIVNNSNLAGHTSPEDVIRSAEKAKELSRISGLPIKMTGIEKGLLPLLEGKLEDLFPMTLQKKYFDVKEI